MRTKSSHGARRTNKNCNCLQISSLTGQLGAVDVIAKVPENVSGSSSRANALRLALSRALACFLPGDLGYNRLRTAGLLTQDDRFSERKKPGQKKARKKPIWWVFFSVFAQRCQCRKYLNVVEISMEFY